MAGRLPSSDREHECVDEGDGPTREALTAGVAIALLLVLLAGAGFMLTEQTALGVLLAGLAWVPFGLFCVEAPKAAGGGQRRSANAERVAPATGVPRPAAVAARVLPTSGTVGVRQTPRVPGPVVRAAPGAGTQARTERGRRSATPASSSMIHVVRRRGKDEILGESLLHFVPPRAARGSAGGAARG